MDNWYLEQKGGLLEKTDDLDDWQEGSLEEILEFKFYLFCMGEIDPFGRYSLERLTESVLDCPFWDL